MNKRIEDKNLWYVDFQLSQITNRHTRRTISKRWNFILSAIEQFSKGSEKGDMKILDAGCGDGVNLKVLTKIPHAEIYGIDYNPLRVERVRKTFPQARIIQADLTKLDMTDGFDVILCSQVLEHIKEDEKVLRGLWNILGDDGILILGVPNEGCFLAQLRNNVIQSSIRKTTDHINFYREEVIRRKIKNEGFYVKDVMYENFFFPHSLISLFFASSTVGFKIMNFFGSILKSQVGGYYFLLEKAYK